MGMSTNVMGLRDDKDETHIKYKKVFIACAEIGIDMPKEAAEYFGDADPYPELLEENLEVELGEALVEIRDTEYYKEMREGYVVDLEKLPKGVKKLLFYNSY